MPPERTLTLDDWLLLDVDDEAEDFMVVVDCLTTLLDDDDELVAEKLELELLENENDEDELLLPVVITADDPVCDTTCDIVGAEHGTRRNYWNSETDANRQYTAECRVVKL